MLHKGKPRIFDASKSASNSRIPSTFTIGKNPHLTKKNKLHSKSTYFYRWGSRLNYVVPSVCILALLVGGIITINPLASDNQVYAINDCGNEGCNDYDSDTTPKVSLTITPNTSDSTNGNVTVGEPAYFSNTITVGGSSISQYSLTLNTASGSSGELVGQDNPYATVGKVSSNTPTTNFPDNTWGYAISTANTTPDKTSLTYNPVPGTDNNNSAFLDFQKNLSGTVNNTYKLVFAAKLGSGMPADHYKTDIYLSAVASATETVENWFRSTARITTMQEMNSTICNNAPEHATSQLTDSRDGKLYWVAKLKDGNCWMTQNLDYDGGGVAIPTESWYPNGDTLLYHDPGNYYYVDGKTQTEVNYSTTALDLHYHIGNYYTWGAATNDVCPFGWQPPLSDSNTINKSFGHMLTQYGLQRNTTNEAYSISKDPLYFVYGGDIYDGRARTGGLAGRYWSSTPYSYSQDGNKSYFAYPLTFDASNVNPSDSSNWSRNAGMSVRCVAK